MARSIFSSNLFYSGTYSGAPVIESPNGTLWQIGVNDSGALQTTQVAEGTPGTLHLYSPNNTRWNVTVTNAGVLITTAV